MTPNLVYDMVGAPEELASALGEKYGLIEFRDESCPAWFFMAIPKGGDQPGDAWLPAAARPGEGRAPSGGGLDREQAITHCLGEAAELVSACWWGTEQLRRASTEELKETAIPIQDLLCISARQYEGRHAWNQRHGAYCWLPARPEPGAAINWVEVRSLDGLESKYVPAAYVYIGYAKPDDPGCFLVGDSNGCAAAATLDQAIAFGFFELVERDATAIWWYGCHRRPSVDLTTLEGCENVLGWLAGRRRLCHVLDITTDLRVPVFAAVSADRDGSALALGFGAHMEPDRAVISALLEMCQMEISLEILRRNGPQIRGKGLAVWKEYATLSSCAQCLPSDDAPVDLQTYRFTNLQDDHNLAGQCAEICANQGLRLFYADLTRNEIGVPVARVIVPGLRHYKPRFAPGRLYDVPAKLGWPTSGIEESGLHSLPLII